MSILYQREKGIVSVTAQQIREDGSNKNTYIVQGFVEGNLVQEEHPKGFRDTAPCARKMFKDLVDQYVPVVEKESQPRAARVLRKMTAAERDAEIAKCERRIERLRTVEIISEEEAAAMQGENAESDAVNEDAESMNEAVAE